MSVCTWAAQRVQQWLGQHTCDTLSSSWARWRPSKACLKLSFFQQMLRLHHPVSVPKNVGSQVLGSSSLATLWTPVCLKLAPVPIETHMSSGLILLNVALARTTSVFTVWVVLAASCNLSEQHLTRAGERLTHLTKHTFRHNVMFIRTAMQSRQSMHVFYGEANTQTGKMKVQIQIASMGEKLHFGLWDHTHILKLLNNRWRNI